MLLHFSLVVLALLLPSGGEPSSESPAKGPEWSLNASIIEACSCPMFCQCYFNTKPHARGPGCCDDEDGLFCRFNNAFKVNRGHFGAVKLDGVKFWVAGDLGGDFSKGQMDWAIVVFDAGTSKEQRDAIAAILPHVYPAKWSSLTSAEGKIEWKASDDEAHALLDGGKTAEVKLKRCAGMTKEPVVIHNLRYWGVPRNDGFVLMPNEVEAYRTGARPFEFKGTNGFMITIDIASSDIATTAETGY
ncbi:MAG: DUF1326 domain-containing protein [Planctomycetota bacterium]